MDLTKEQIRRYSHQIVLKEVGGIGQKKLFIIFFPYYY